MSVYQPIFQKVTIRAFRMMESQRLCHGLIENKVETHCQGRWSLVYGLPCGHTIRSRIASRVPLEMGDINCHWYIDKEVDTLLSTAILDPLPQEAIRGSKKKPTSHTGRILSGHELVEKAIRHCGVCTPIDHVKVGCNGCKWSTHNRTKCPTFHGVVMQVPGVPLSQYWRRDIQLASQIVPLLTEAPIEPLVAIEALGASYIDRARRTRSQK
jgi:hypothetical protein